MKSPKEDSFKEIQRERILLSQNLNPECEYVEVCRGCGQICSIGNKKDCVRRHIWETNELGILFEEHIDTNKNYLFYFYKGV
ncbi:MAG: hypothetical protein AABX99_03855 [Nanoarchaeota archaeon]